MRWVFLVATLLGLFSTAQAYRLTTLNPKAHVDGIEIGSLLILNLTLWYVPAALMAPIFRIAHPFPSRRRALDPRDRDPRHGRRAVLHRSRRRDDGGAGDAVAGAPADAGRALAVVHPGQYLRQSRLVPDDVCRRRRYELRPRVLPRIAGTRAQGGAPRNQPHGGAAEDARGGTPPALPVQHAARDLDARAHAIPKRPIA